MATRPLSPRRALAEEKQTRACALTLSGVGVILLIAGGALTGSSGYQAARAAALLDYDRVVDAWNDRHAAVFNASAWSLRLDGRQVALLDREAAVPPAGGASVGAGAGGADADAAASDGEVSRPARVVRFALAGSLWDFAPTAAAAAAAAVVAETATSDNEDAAALRALAPGAAHAAGAPEAAAAAAAAVAWARHPHDVALLALGPGGVALAELPLLTAQPLLRRTLLPDANWKTCEYGSGGTLVAADGGAAQGEGGADVAGAASTGGEGMCAVWDAVGALCVVVSQRSSSAGDTWQLDARFGAGASCDAVGSSGSDAAADSAPAGPAVLARVPAPDGGAAAAGALWAAVQRAAPGLVACRSAEDPALWASHATQGSGVFARQQAEHDAAGRVLLILGGLALLTAALLAGPGVIAAARRRAGAAGGLLAGAHSGRGRSCEC